MRQCWAAPWASDHHDSDQEARKFSAFLVLLILGTTAEYHSLNPRGIPVDTVPSPILQMRRQNLQSDTVSKGQSQDSNPDMFKASLCGFLPLPGTADARGCKTQLFPCGVYSLLVVMAKHKPG